MGLSGSSFNPHLKACLSDLPHNDVDQPHGGFIQGIKEFQEDSALFAHFPNDEAECDAEDDQPQNIDPIRIGAADGVFLGDILPGEDTRSHSALQPGQEATFTFTLAESKNPLMSCLPQGHSPPTSGSQGLIMGAFDGFSFCTGSQMQVPEALSAAEG